MTKKLVSFILIAAIIVGGGYYVYNRFVKKSSTTILESDIVTPTTDNPFPDANQTNITPGAQTTQRAATNSFSITSTSNGILSHIDTDSVAGATFITTPNETLIRYTEKKSGHIFDVNVASSTQNVVSNTTLPNIYESLWIGKGDKTVFRYLKDNTETIQSYLSKITTGATSSGITFGYFLPQDIETISVAPKSARIFYITSNTQGSEGVIQNVDTQKKGTVLNTPFREWISFWPYENLITLTTKASSNVLGYLYFLNTETNSTKNILQDIPGLTTLTNLDGTRVLYADATLTLRVYTIKTGNSTDIEIKTLPEKCVWSQKEKNTAFCAASTPLPTGNYPDDWYQGKISFADDIYKINTDKGTINPIVGAHSFYNLNIDVVSLTLSPDEKSLLFTNKRDGTLWLAKIQ